MRIYLDVLFFINATMDYVVLTMVSAIFRYHASIKQRIVASMIGALLACISMIVSPYQTKGIQMLYSLGISACMVGIAYGFHGGKGVVKRMMSIYLITYALGGAFVWILQETQIGYLIIALMKERSIRKLYGMSFLLISVGVFCLLLLLFGFGTMIKEEQQFLYPVTVMIREGVSIHTIGFLDTGNRLRETKTGKAVFVAEFSVMQKALPDHVRRWLEEYFKGEERVVDTVPKELCWIPFSSVGKKEGTLPAICCERVIVAKQGKMQQKEVFVAMTNQVLSPTGEYDMLLHTDLWRDGKET